MCGNHRDCLICQEEEKALERLNLKRCMHVPSPICPGRSSTKTSACMGRPMSKNRWKRGCAQTRLFSLYPNNLVQHTLNLRTGKWGGGWGGVGGAWGACKKSYSTPLRPGMDDGAGLGRPLLEGGGVRQVRTGFAKRE